MSNAFEYLTQVQTQEQRYPAAGPGHYILEVERCMYFTTFQKGQAWITEFKILESTNPSFPKGTHVSFYRNMTNIVIGMREVKALMLAVLGIRSGDDVTVQSVLAQLPALAAAAGDARNLLAGLIVGCEIRETPDKKGRMDQSRPGQVKLWANWSFLPVKDQRQEALQKLAAAPHAQALPPRTPAPAPMMPMQPQLPFGGGPQFPSFPQATAAPMVPQNPLGVAPPAPRWDAVNGRWVFG